MKLFKLLRRCEFWPHVPWRAVRGDHKQWLEAGSIVIEFTPPLQGRWHTRPGPRQVTVEVWEGEFKGFQRYANKLELVECSPLELLAGEANDV